MELQILFSFTTFLLFFILFFKTLACKSQSTNSQTTNEKLPPGPRKLPIIGNLHNLIGHRLHHRALAELARKYGPLMHLKLGQMSMIVVSSPKMAEEVMKTHDLSFAHRPELLVTKMVPNAGTDIVSAPYGDYWRQLKKLCILELLTARRVQSFCSFRKEEALNLVESIRSSSAMATPINITEKIDSFTSGSICRAAFGNKCKDQPAFIRLTKQLLSLAGGFTLSEIFPNLNFLHIVSGMRTKLVKVHDEAGKILDSIIHEHEKKAMSTKYSKDDREKEDLVDVLLRLQNSGSREIPLSPKDVKAIIWGMFTGGTDTSATIATWAMSEMMRNPRVLHKAQAEAREKLKGKKTITETDIQELNYLKLVIKETMRLHPPAPLLFPRECREQCEINGYKIPIKTKVFVNVWAIGRDPEYWRNPESFIPERFSENSIDFKGNNFEYTPFGAGRRMCPGVSFGVHNIELPLAQMLYHFDWKLPDGMKPEELDMTEVFGAIVGRKNDLYLVASPYTPS